MCKIIKFPFFKSGSTDSLRKVQDSLQRLVELVPNPHNDPVIIKMLTSKSKSSNPVAIPYTAQAIKNDLQAIRTYINMFQPDNNELACLIVVQMYKTVLKNIPIIVGQSGYSPVSMNRLIYMGTFCAAQCSLMEFKEVDIKKYTISTCGDSRTCPRCRKMDGKTHLVSKAVVGKTLPPFCDACRCIISPVFK